MLPCFASLVALGAAKPDAYYITRMEVKDNHFMQLNCIARAPAGVPAGVYMCPDVLNGTDIKCGINANETAVPPFALFTALNTTRQDMLLVSGYETKESGTTCLTASVETLKLPSGKMSGTIFVAVPMTTSADGMDASATIARKVAEDLVVKQASAFASVKTARNPF